MRKRKRNRKTPVGGEEEEEQEGDEGKYRPRSKGPLTSTQIRLTENQEDRLGKLNSSVQWIVKIAQDRGCNACLAIQSTADVQMDQEGCKASLLTLDNQHVALHIRGSWANTAASVLNLAGGERLLLLSGLGARIPSSGSQIIFESGKMMAEILDARTLESQGWLEVAGDEIVAMPKWPDLDVRGNSSSVNLQPVSSVNGGTNAFDLTGAQTTAPKDDGRAPARISIGTPQAVRPDILSSPLRTPNNSEASLRCSTSATPGWLRTPVPCAGGSSSFETPPREVRRSAAAAPIPFKASKVVEAKIFGSRLYTPVRLLKCEARTVFNVIGLIMTDNSIRQSLSGARDWKITIGLCDVEQSKDPHCQRVSFNLFSTTEAGLPRCKPGSILLLRGIKIKPFNSAPQGSGYPGDFDWIMIDTSIDDPNDAFTIPNSSGVLLPPERKEMVRLYHWHRKQRSRGQSQVVASSRSSRPRINVCGMEKELFFDATVEILKIWDHARPFEMYVTDYTSHPLLYSANDVHLGIQSREELSESQDDCSDSGNGRVLPVSLWDDQEENIKHINVGMLVHLENVRTKMQPNNYLCGTMGGGWQCREEKLRVILVRDKGVIEDFKRRKEEFIQDVALKRAERMHAMRAVESRRRSRSIEGSTSEVRGMQVEEGDSAPSTAELPSFHSMPSGMPPPGQKPLSLNDNVVNQQSRLPSSGTLSSLEQSMREKVAPTVIDEETLSSCPLTSVEHIIDLTADELKSRKTFVCEGIVRDILPRNIDEIVKVQCGLCKSVLPVNHAFCAKCAEEDGKDLHYSFSFALCVEDLAYTRNTKTQEEAKEDDSGPVMLPVVVRGEEARHFLHGFHPKDIRDRKATMDRLKKRLLPLLGSKIIYGHAEKEPSPSKFALLANGSMLPDGSVRPRYYLTNTRLIKDGT
ncbi:hypothetical protein CBS101457_002357 [Exobasidium rhododendri]|nr:hypothetical protein CBS101457_002357 [Exobasidium rhododendri]